MSRETVELAKSLHLHNGPDGMTADDLIVLRGELAVMRGRLATALDDLEKANERARTLAADVSRLAQENAAQALALSKANHTADELRRQLRLANRDDAGHARPLTLTDRGGDGDGYCAYADMVME